MVFIHLLAGTPNAYYLKYQLNVVLVILAMEVRDYCKCGNYVSVEPFEGAFANFRHDYIRYYLEWVWRSFDLHVEYIQDIKPCMSKYLPAKLLYL